MDVDDVISKIPSTEKLFGIAWIICWILAIWSYHLQFFLTGLFCLFIALILTDRIGKTEKKKQSPLPAVLSMDKSTKTLTVQKIYEENLQWNDHEICSGDAILPVGAIKEGDVVTNCSGNVALRHTPSNKILGAYDFE